MKKIANYIKEIFLPNLVYDILKWLLGLALYGFSFSLSFATLKGLINAPLFIDAVFSVAIAAFTTFIVLSIYVRRSNSNGDNTNEYTGEYKIESKTVSFTYGKTKSLYTSDIALRFIKDCRTYYGRFYWSGAGEGHIRVVNPNFTLTELRRRTRYVEYVVHFDRMYKKGTPLTVRLEGEMDDPGGTASPYFATSISVPTDNLHIKLKVDPSIYPVSTLEREIVPPECFTHENCELVAFDANGEYVWNVPEPKLYYQYSLVWTFRT